MKLRATVDRHGKSLSGAETMETILASAKLASTIDHNEPLRTRWIEGSRRGLLARRRDKVIRNDQPTMRESTGSFSYKLACSKRSFRSGRLHLDLESMQDLANFHASNDVATGFSEYWGIGTILFRNRKHAEMGSLVHESL